MFLLYAQKEKKRRLPGGHIIQQIWIISTVFVKGYPRNTYAKLLQCLSMDQWIGIIVLYYFQTWPVLLDKKYFKVLSISSYYKRKTSSASWWPCFQCMWIIWTIMVEVDPRNICAKLFWDRACSFGQDDF